MLKPGQCVRVLPWHTVPLVSPRQVGHHNCSIWNGRHGDYVTTRGPANTQQEVLSCLGGDNLKYSVPMACLHYTVWQWWRESITLKDIRGFLTPKNVQGMSPWETGILFKKYILFKLTDYQKLYQWIGKNEIKDNKLLKFSMTTRQYWSRCHI